MNYSNKLLLIHILHGCIIESCSKDSMQDCTEKDCHPLEDDSNSKGLKYDVVVLKRRLGASGTSVPEPNPGYMVMNCNWQMLKLT